MRIGDIILCLIAIFIAILTLATAITINTVGKY